ncbi:MAG: hypothetical protein PVJ09_02890 [Candidatus Woesebacteria bacterium]|jgi:hypothetical protein
MKRIQKLAISAGSVLTTLQMTAVSAHAAITAKKISPGTGYSTDIGAMINGLLRIVMVIAALLVFAYLIWGGIEWITSGGDKGKTENARNKITQAVIGLVVIAASYAILTLVLNFLGFEEGLDTVFQQDINLSGE